MSMHILLSPIVVGAQIRLAVRESRNNGKLHKTCRIAGDIDACRQRRQHPISNRNRLCRVFCSSRIAIVFPLQLSWFVQGQGDDGNVRQQQQNDVAPERNSLGLTATVP